MMARASAGALNWPRAGSVGGGPVGWGWPGGRWGGGGQVGEQIAVGPGAALLRRATPRSRRPQPPGTRLTPRLTSGWPHTTPLDGYPAHVTHSHRSPGGGDVRGTSAPPTFPPGRSRDIPQRSPMAGWTPPRLCRGRLAVSAGPVPTSAQLGARLTIRSVSRGGRPIRATGLASWRWPGPPRRLAPGRYELICNLPGHYAAGMFIELDVQ